VGKEGHLTLWDGESPSTNLLGGKGRGEERLRRD